MPPTISEDWTIHWPNTPKGLFLMWLGGFFCKTLIVNIFGWWWWCVEGYCIQWESSIPTQGSAELHGVAFCDEHGDEPEWLLQGHQERIPQGTPSRPWHEPAESAGQHKIPLTQHFSDWYYYLSVQKKKKSAKHRRCNNDTEPSEVITIVVTSLSFVYAVDVALETTHRKVITHKLHYPVGECTPSLIWTARRTKLNSLVWVISSLCCARLWI